MKEMHHGRYGSFPERTACPANNSGYGPHESNAEEGSALVLLTGPGYGPDTDYELHPCRLCGGVFVKKGKGPS